MTDAAHDYPIAEGDRVCHHSDYSFVGTVMQIDRNLPHPTTCRVLWEDCIELDTQWTNKLLKVEDL